MHLGSAVQIYHSHIEMWSNFNRLLHTWVKAVSFHGRCPVRVIPSHHFWVLQSCLQCPAFVSHPVAMVIGVSLSAAGRSRIHVVAIVYRKECPHLCLGWHAICLSEKNVCTCIWAAQCVIFMLCCTEVFVVSCLP